MKERKWADILQWLTGDNIENIDETLQTIPEAPREHFELLEQMLNVAVKDMGEQEKDMKEFEACDYYIPESVNFFNIPMFGEIITYKLKEPFIKCFMFSNPSATQRRKLEKIEDIPISEEMPKFLIRLLRKINSSVVPTDNLEKYTKEPNYNSYIKTEDLPPNYKNILESAFFKKYNIQVKEND